MSSSGQQTRCQSHEGFGMCSLVGCFSESASTPGGRWGWKLLTFGCCCCFSRPILFHQPGKGRRAQRLPLQGGEGRESPKNPRASLPGAQANRRTGCPQTADVACRAAVRWRPIPKGMPADHLCRAPLPISSAASVPRQRCRTCDRVLAQTPDSHRTTSHVLEKGCGRGSGRTKTSTHTHLPVVETGWMSLPMLTSRIRDLLSLSFTQVRQHVRRG